MPAEKRGAPGVCQSKHTGRGNRDRPRLRSSFKESYREVIIAPGLGLPQLGVGKSSIPVRAENLRRAPTVSRLAGDQGCLWLVFTETWCGASWLLAACFCIIHHSQSVLQLEERHISHSQEPQARPSSFNSLLIPSSREKSPAALDEKGT